jgi:putative sigma-54 modulation protein
MEISISARHGSLTPEQHDYIEKKLPKLAHLFDKINMAKVTVDLTAHPPEVELVVSEPRQTFVAKEQHDVVQAAFDNCLAKMEGQLRRHKEKLHDHHGGPDRHAL